MQPHTDHTLAERTSCGVTTRAYGEPWLPSASRYPSSAPRKSSAAPSAALPAKASPKLSVARASSPVSAVVAAGTSSELRRLPATLLCTAGLHYLTAQNRLKHSEAQAQTGIHTTRTVTYLQSPSPSSGSGASEDPCCRPVTFMTGAHVIVLSTTHVVLGLQPPKLSAGSSPTAGTCSTGRSLLGGAAGAAALLQHLSLLQARAPCSKGPYQGGRPLLKGPPSSSNARHRRSTSVALEPSPATPTPSDRDRRSFNCAQEAKWVLSSNAN